MTSVSLGVTGTSSGDDQMVEAIIVVAQPYYYILFAYDHTVLVAVQENGLQ